jgi:sarcosine oxidase subunit beta
MSGSDAIVIGGGAIGTSTAYYLSKRGARTTLLEAGELGCGSSSACDGFVIMQSKTPGPHLSMAMASAEMYGTLSDELGWDVRYRKRGGMIVIESSREYEAMRVFAERQREAGLDVELVDGNEARRLEPALSERVAGATVSRMDGQVNPTRLVMGFARAAERLGLRIERGTKVTGFIVSGSKITGVRTTGGDFHADNIICCAGVHTPALLRPLGLNIPIEPRRGQLIVTEPAERVITRVMLCARYIAAKYHPEILANSDDESVRLGVGLALEQSESGGFLIGSTREFVGFNRNVTVSGIRAVAAHASKIVPALRGVKAVRFFAGLRPYTPDGRAFMGVAPGYGGLFVAAGHEGDGVAYAPITGRSMAELVLAGHSAVDLEPFSLCRKI